MADFFENVSGGFALNGEVTACEILSCGHINRTYLIKTSGGCRYILQRVNDTVFRDVDALMENIRLVTNHLRAKTSDPRRVLTLVPTVDGKSYLKCESGCWRVYHYIEDSLCLQLPNSPNDFYESAIGIGGFQQMLMDFPAQSLYEVIPNFHNTPDRYRLFREAVENDRMGRADSVKREIDFFLSREKEMSLLQTMRDSGALPVRVTHNDTKLNNVLLDSKTGKALCVIDLDTVMPGLSVYDYGDSIRFGASTAGEDEKDLSRVNLDLSMFRIYTQGYLTACRGLSAAEVEMLPLGAKTMTLECGMRFLTDHLNGDVYFSISQENQNLDRSRTQAKLVRDMEANWDQLHDIVQSVLRDTRRA